MGGVDALTRFPPCSAPYYTIPNDAQPLMPLTLPPPSRSIFLCGNGRASCSVWSENHQTGASWRLLTERL